MEVITPPWDSADLVRRLVRALGVAEFGRLPRAVLLAILKPPHSTRVFTPKSSQRPQCSFFVRVRLVHSISGLERLWMQSPGRSFNMPGVHTSSFRDVP